MEDYKTLSRSPGMTWGAERLLKASRLSSRSLDSPRPGPWREGISYPAGFGIRIDPRSHLEVFDRKHRYGKNLRLYYEEWVRLRVEMQFFEWLDCDECVELPDCSRQLLEDDTVYYCTSDTDREQYLVRIGTDGLLYHRPSKHSQDNFRAGEDRDGWIRLTTQAADGWIFVLKNSRIYAHEKVTEARPRFHHSSFFAGADVDAAGMFVVENGVLVQLYPHSGHYRPGEVHMYFLLHFLEATGVTLQDVEVDAQRLAHVARQKLPGNRGKARKIDTPHMWAGDRMLNFLRIKKHAWESGLFHDILLINSSCTLPVPINSAGYHTTSHSHYASGSFGGGNLGHPTVLYPAISAYPLTARLRDELIMQATNNQPTSNNQTGTELIVSSRYVKSRCNSFQDEGSSDVNA